MKIVSDVVITQDELVALVVESRKAAGKAFAEDVVVVVTVEGSAPPSAPLASVVPKAEPVPAPVPPQPTPTPAVDHFPSVLKFILKWEGETFEDDPSDPGGATKYGIDARSHPGVDIKNLSLEQATEIYHEEWIKELCDKLPYPVSASHFNYSVNTGSSQSVKFLQRALEVTDDGQFGPATQAALAKADPLATALAMIDHSDIFYKDLAASKPSMEKYLHGWINRNADLRSFIHATA